MQHYFIGIPIPSYIGSYVEDLRNTYQLREAYKIIPHIDDLHVTLFYIGPLSESKLAKLEERLSAIAASHSRFSLAVDGISFFGSKLGPRVIYLSIKEQLLLTNMQRDISNEVNNIIENPIPNRFTPHITIAKKWKGLDDFLFDEEKRTPIEVAVHHFSLFSIHPNENPMYEETRKFRLV